MEFTFLNECSFYFLNWCIMNINKKNQTFLENYLKLALRMVANFRSLYYKKHFH